GAGGRCGPGIPLVATQGKLADLSVAGRRPLGARGQPRFVPGPAPAPPVEAARSPSRAGHPGDRLLVRVLRDAPAADRWLERAGFLAVEPVVVRWSDQPRVRGLPRV